MSHMTIHTWNNHPYDPDEDHDVICEGCEQVNIPSFARITLASGRVVYLCEDCIREIASRFAQEDTTP